MFAYFSPFLTYSSKKRIAKNASIQQYYKELSSLLCCDNKSKKKFLHDFVFQLDEFASEHDKETISYKMLSDRFGSPTEIANAFLAETNSLQLQNLIIHQKKKKKTHFNFAFDCFSVSNITSNVQDLSKLSYKT